MMNDNANKTLTPPISGQKAVLGQVDISVLDACLDKSHIRPSVRYEAPPEILWVHDACVATLGNFSVTTGKAKSRKTFNVSALVAAALCNGTVLDYRAQFPDNKRKILYIDTEQSLHHCDIVQTRILTMAGLPRDQDCENLVFLNLREFIPPFRRQLVERAIEREKEGLGLVVIDGIRDLMLDINNAEESVLLVNDLMRLSSVYNIHIHVTLHLNKSDDNVRGHIGTEVNNKAETVLLVAKDRYDKNMSEVSPLYMRGKEFKSFVFQIDEDGIPESVLGYKQPKQEKKSAVSFSDMTEEQHMQALDAAFKHGVISGKNRTASALKDAYAKANFERGLTTFVKILDHLIDKGTVVQQKNHQYCLQRDFPNLPLKNEEQND